MFKIFRNPFIHNYVQGYLDGYSDAESEFMNTLEDLDVEYWRGYNNAMIEMSENSDQNGGMQ